MTSTMPEYVRIDTRLGDSARHLCGMLHALLCMPFYLCPLYHNHNRAASAVENLSSMLEELL